MGICESPFIKMVFPACSMIENRRALQAIGVVVIGIILLLVLYVFDMHSWTAFGAISVATIGLAYAAHYFDPAGRIGVNVVAPGVGNIAYQAATSAEEMI